VPFSQIDPLNAQLASKRPLFPIQQTTFVILNRDEDTAERRQPRRR